LVFIALNSLALPSILAMEMTIALKRQRPSIFLMAIRDFSPGLAIGAEHPPQKCLFFLGFLPFSSKIIIYIKIFFLH
jgi:hypothetical protein